MGKSKFSKREDPTLYKLWQRFSKDEKSHWGSWREFTIWCSKCGYEKIFSYHKLNKLLPYNKKNLEFGLFVNGEFFTIKELREHKYFYNNEINKFVTSKKIKNLIVEKDEFTKIFNKQESKRKTLSDKAFKRFKKKFI